MSDRERNKRGRFTLRILGAIAAVVWSAAAVLVLRHVLTPPDAAVMPVAKVSEQDDQNESDSISDELQTILERRDSHDGIWLYGNRLELLNPTTNSEGPPRIMKGVLIPWPPSDRSVR